MFVIIMMAKFRSLKQTEPYIVICLVGLLKGDEKLPLSYGLLFSFERKTSVLFFSTCK